MLKRRGSALMRAAFATGAGTFIRSARKGVVHELARRRRSRFYTRLFGVVGRVATYLAIVTVVFNVVTAFRSALREELKSR